MPIPVPQSLPQRTVRSMLAGGAALLLAASVTAGCGAGFDAQTNQPYQAAEGANGGSGAIAVRNVLVIADDQGSGTLYGVVVNTGDSDDRLASIRVDQSVQGVKVTGGSAQPLPAGQAITLGGGRPLPNATGSPGKSETPSGDEVKPIRLTGAKPGRVLKMTISFGTAGPITVQVPVITTDHYSPTPKPSSAEG